MDSDSFYNLDTYKTIQFIKFETVRMVIVIIKKQIKEFLVLSFVHVWGIRLILTT